ncbi:MAG: hypothetical protein FJX61_13480 [Alphaproteobacteria bacterium]|nr:hypothetical protein [Alphaproteobacteria bacterium]
MPVVFVAYSKALAEWAGEVGLSKHVFKVGVAAGKAEEAVAAYNAEGFAGQTDWKVLKKEKVEAADEATTVEKIARREREVDPTYYPKIRGARGLFRVKIENVEKAIYVQQTLDGGELRDVKIKPADIAVYLLRNAVA